MATWKSKESVKYMSDFQIDWVGRELSWQYNTTADSLMVTTKTDKYNDYDGPVEAKEDVEYYGQEDALALLELLVDWAETYEGEGTVERLLKRRLEHIEKR